MSKAQITGVDENGDERPIKTDYTGAQLLSTKNSPFDELSVQQRSVIIEIKSIYGISALRDITDTAGSGTVSHTGSEYKLSTTTSGTDSATLDSAERGRYIPGLAAELGSGIRIPTLPTGDQYMRWGYFDDNDGFFWGVDGNGLYIGYRCGGSDTIIRRSDWNIDQLDGTGSDRNNRSGFELNLDEGNIFQIMYSWYGYGEIIYQISSANETEQQKTIMVHRERIYNQTSVANPNLPLRAIVNNNGETSAFDGYVSGRQYSIMGEFEPNRRITGELRSGQTVSDTFVPLVTFRKKPNFVNASVKMSEFELRTNQDLILELRLNGSLTNASFGSPANIPSSETATEVDTSATDITGGIALTKSFGDTVSKNKTNLSTSEVLDYDFPETQNVTLCARIAGTTDAEVDTIMKVREEW